MGFSKSGDKVSTGEALDALAVLFDLYDRPDIEKAGEELQIATDEARRRNLPQLPPDMPDDLKRAHRVIMAHNRARSVLRRAGRL